MKRRVFLTGSVTGSIGAVALAAPADHLNEPLMASPAVVMAPRADGVEVVWAVTRLSRGWVECRDAAGVVVKHAADDFGFVPQAERVMRVRISGLRPGSAYDLRSVVEAIDGRADRVEGPWKPFRTLAPTADEAHFVVWNDTHEHHDTIRKLHEVTPAADFLLWNGDTCNDWHQEDWLIPTLLNPAGQDVSAGRPLLLTWGNHDVRGKWAFKAREMVAMPDGHPYYAFRNGPVACIGLHTGEDKPDDHPSFGGRVAFESLRREQTEWLGRVIETPEIRDAPHKVVFCHIPLRWISEPDVTRYQSGEYDHFSRSSRAAWHDSLVKWGAQVIISGHTHRPAVIPADESFPYAQMVSGGPKIDQAHWIDAKADANGLLLTLRDLNGATTHELRVPRA